MEKTMLLGQLGTERHFQPDFARLYAFDCDAQMMHQALTLETIAHALAHGNKGVRLLRLVLHHLLRSPFYSVRSEEHTSELQSLMRISYAVFCLKKKTSIATRQEQLYLSRITEYISTT